MPVTSQPNSLDARDWKAITRRVGEFATGSGLSVVVLQWLGAMTPTPGTYAALGVGVAVVAIQWVQARYAAGPTDHIADASKMVRPHGDTGEFYP